ncbi:MAG TPA: YceI family protein [Geobacteraceae bacterium]
MTTTITCAELHACLQGASRPLLIDVLTPEEYACCHLPGAGNACIYEMVFLDRVAELVADRTTPLVVYDATGTTLAAATAREKLQAAGYRDVRVLAGGLAGWAAAGFPLEGEPLPAEPQLGDGTYRLDPEHSVLEWTGRNLNNRHYGRIAFIAGELVVRSGALAHGAVTLDMTSISNLDLQDEGYRQLLLRHLRSEDFFAVDRFPEATIALTGWQAIANATPGTANYLVQGELTIKGVTRSVNFPAAVAPQADGSIKAQAALEIDRTDWGVGYGSGKLFERLGMHLVHDLVTIELFIVAR